MTFGLVPGGVGEDAADVETAAGKLEALSFNWGEGRLIIRGINISNYKNTQFLSSAAKNKKSSIFFLSDFQRKNSDSREISGFLKNVEFLVQFWIFRIKCPEIKLENVFQAKNASCGTMSTSKRIMAIQVDHHLVQ